MSQIKYNKQLIFEKQKKTQKMFGLNTGMINKKHRQKPAEQKLGVQGLSFAVRQVKVSVRGMMYKNVFSFRVMHYNTV